MRTWALALLLAAAPLARAAEQQAAPAERLREVEEQRGRVEFFLRQIEGKQTQVLDVLEGLERELRQADVEAQLAKKRATQTAQMLEKARTKEAEVEQRREKVAEELAPRLLLRYRLRGASYLRALLSAPNLGDFLWRRRMVDRVLGSDLALVEELARLQREATAARQAVEKSQAELKQDAETARARAEDARARRGVQAEVLGGLRKERSTYQRTVAELERARQSLLSAIAQMPPTPDGLGGFGARRGRLVLPAEGTIEVGFGRQVDPKLGVTVQKGIDVRAPQGAPVHAPHAASVGFAGWFRGFGNLVILDHGEGYYTLYAHLADVRVSRGDRVGEGSVLGSVGDTGSLKGPYLYFEIRSGAKALDPTEWLAKR